MAPIFRTSTFSILKPLLQHRFVTRSLLTTSSDLKQSVKNQTHVSTALATQLLSKKYPRSNVVFSPLSIHAVLSILAAGSKGKTHDQLLDFLKAKSTDELSALSSKLVSLILADGSPKGGPRLSFANSVWIEKTLSLKPSFKQVVNTVYKATCKQVDFKKAKEAAKEVNLWGKKQTNGLITEVITADAINNNLTWLIFANAVCFKGEWLKKFKPSQTKNFDFYLLNGNKVKVPFMTSSDDQFIRVYDDFKILGLPYVQGQDKRKFIMYFILPHAKDGLQSLVKKIGTTTNFLDRHIPREKVKVREFMIPKYKISFGFEASHMLKELGLVLPFNIKDGMTEMVESFVGESVYGLSIHHKSFIEVNEEGTKAVAISRFMGCGSARNIYDRVDFVADHPFLFVIREDVTGVVLFMGQVVNPRGG